ncbi:DUF2125 domain-containing protein [Puniceibacterium sp. IMCC21224]|uniref:DUF2125 domain-containing protein n=1 Tax=Puniceibacterium sp. IMCC21224 TaxID=1618204 RepID=UPI00064E11BC|nr:DUF2125 domain-containing protein [Puniceibacterium sp. IMCC21224]KMK65564.1 hypothetical protein IMCC21224_11396 [Puniceibacterium sp. IMCC21224]
MFDKTGFWGSTALALALTAGAAQADVTPQQVWDELETYFQDFGYVVNATETQTGNVLTVTDFSVTMDMPEEDGSLRFDASEVVLTDLGDGRISIDFPNVMPITMSISAPDEDPIELVVNYTQDGLDMIASGAPGDLVYDYTADGLSMILVELVVDGKPIDRSAARVEVTMTGLEGQSMVKNTTTRDISQVMKMSGLSYDLAFNDPDSDGAGLFSGTLSDLTFEGSTSIPADLDMNAPSALATSGLKGSGRFDYAAGQSQFSATERGDTTAGQTSSEGASLLVGFSGEAITYAQTGKNMTVAMSGGELPFPVTVAMEETAFNLTMPVAESEEPQKVAMGVTLGGFTMSDLLWNLFDPAKALPRDPATVSFDLVGLATPFINLFDPAAVEALDATGGVPGELNSLTLNNLTVDAAGTRLTGVGDFTFDNSDLETYDGMPLPVGSVMLEVSGANALIDKLIAMGLMAEQDAMGARMMMSMFTVPGDSPDNLKSKLEFNEQGHISANGQRIK